MTTIFLTESSKNIGGQELQLLQQARGLKAQGYSPVILCRPGSRIEEEALKQGLRVEQMGFRNAIHPPSVVKLAGLLRKHKPVAVVCHSGHDSNVSALTVHAMNTLGLLSPRPALLRMRTYQPGPAKAFTYNRLFDYTLAPSKALRDQLLTNPHIDSSRVGVLYPGIDFDQILKDASRDLPKELTARLLQEGTGPILVHAAMLRQEKGHEFMLEVVKELVSQFPRLLYVIAGEGQTREQLEQKVKGLGLADNVFFAGMLKPVAPLLAKATVVVMPSSYEPLGMSQIEALGLEVPVVVSNVGGLPETVQNDVTGKVCLPPHVAGAKEQWITALLELLGNPVKSKELAKAGKEAVIAQFGVSSNLDRLLDQFRRTGLN